MTYIIQYSADNIIYLSIDNIFDLHEVYTKALSETHDDTMIACACVEAVKHGDFTVLRTN